jgi:hypothetical protein
MEEEPVAHTGEWSILLSWTKVRIVNGGTKLTWFLSMTSVAKLKIISQ